AYSWPGNVRELRNVIESAVSLAKTKHIIVSDLPDYIAHLKPEKSDGPQTIVENLLDSGDIVLDGDLYTMMDALEKQLIQKAIDQCGGSRTRAAALLGIHRTALYKKMSKLGLGEGRISNEYR
ncbi:MAG TPA: helix-turn-helix domain-containing protein, partial [Fusibacter sp.]|nr:helix-turn-helix domain-containing protein [Fusibacter sp.]